jgi:hypothetical protein
MMACTPQSAPVMRTEASCSNAAPCNTLRRPPARACGLGACRRRASVVYRMAGSRIACCSGGGARGNAPFMTLHVPHKIVISDSINEQRRCGFHIDIQKDSVHCTYSSLHYKRVQQTQGKKKTSGHGLEVRTGNRTLDTQDA